MQEILVAFTFLFATIAFTQHVRKLFGNSQSGCAKGCSSCKIPQIPSVND